MYDGLQIVPNECLDNEESFNFYQKFNLNKELQIAPNQSFDKIKEKNELQIAPNDEYEEIGFNFR